MSTTPPPRQTESSHPPQLDARLIQWMAVQALEGRRARLMDAGAGPNTRMDLARIFTDLPVRARGGSSRSSTSPQTAMPLLLTRPAANPVRFAQRGRIAARPGWLLVGGPGSGKSTLTTMVAQVLRLPWIERQVEVLPEPLRKTWNDFQKQFRDGLAEFAWLNNQIVFPIRIDLPTLAQWLSGRKDDGLSLWDYLAAQATRDLRLEGISVELSSSVWQAAITSAGSIVWILDGLDEVSRSAGRERVIDFIRKTISSSTHRADTLLVATRPQGYTGEFDELDEMELIELDAAVARQYAEKLLRAWTSGGSAKELAERLQRMEAEFGRTEIAELLTTPLHTTLAALLVCGPGKLPSALCKLFDAYFDMIFARELGKTFEQGIQDEERAILRQLHARAGLTLHVRAQEDAGVDPSLRRRNLREMLTCVYKDQGYQGDELHTRVERMMRFATDRLVLLLHSSEGEYTFGVRSLQEYFAADALLEGETADVRKRIETIVLDPHWSNVLALMTSRLALATEKRDQTRALQLTASVCEDLNAGRIGGEAAKRCFMGSRLAMEILEETEDYGRPWLHDPLWKLALEVADAPSQQGIVWFTEARIAASRLFAWTDRIDVHNLLGVLAASWTGPKADSYQTCMLNAAHTWLSQTDNDAKLTGWRILAGFLAEENVRAIELADQFLPTTSDDAKVIVEALLALPIRSAWLWSFIDQHTEWFSPACGYPHQFDEDDGDLPLPLEFYDSMRRHAGETEDLEFSLSISAVLMSDMDEAYWKEFERKLPTTSTWRAWKAVARFHAEPGHLCLADILDTASDKDVFSDVNRMASLFPWPIQACLEYVQTPRQAGELATRVRKGELGTIDDWRAAEARWHVDTNREMGEFISALTSSLPWSRDIAQQGIVLTSNFTITQTDDDFIRRLNVAVLHCIDSGTAKHPLTFKFFLSTLDPNEHIPPQVASALAELIVEQLRGGGIRSFRELAHDSSPYGRFIYFMLLTFGADPDATSVDLKDAFEAIGLPLPLVSALHSLANEETDDPTPILLAALASSPAPTGVVRDILLGSLFLQLRDSVTPAFTTAESWTEHALEAPFLSSQSPTQNPPRLVRIDELRNIRLFKEVPRVDTPFPTPNADHGQWIVFIGENGAGKTTLLRSLALTLAPPAIASKLLDEELPLLTNGSEGRVEILLETGPIGITLRRKERTEVIESTTPEAIRPWVVAYGVRRGNARGEKDRVPETGPLGELHTLFDRPASLHNAAIWLKDLDYDVLRERQKALDSSPGPREGIWNAVVKALKKLLGVSKVEVDDDRIVFVHHAQFGRVRLDALSDGYLTTAGWITDMIARWLERQRELDEPVGANVLDQMTGFVLIDEIDLHLHPMWQLRIIDDIRALFPRLSFIVTTHNPLTLQGARRGEIFVMRREGDRVEIVPKNIRPGQDVDRVLFEQFGVKHTFDRKTRELLDRHREMLDNGVPPEDADRKKIEAQLAERFGDAANQMGRGRDTSPLRAEERSLLAPYLKKKPGVA